MEYSPHTHILFASFETTLHYTTRRHNPEDLDLEHILFL
jgi:hypothetical protein